MLLDKYYKHNGVQFSVLRIIISSIPQFHKIIIYCMIEKEEIIWRQKISNANLKRLQFHCVEKKLQYLMILQFMAYELHTIAFFNQFWFPFWFFVSCSISFMLGVSIYVSILFNIWVKGFLYPRVLVTVYM